MNTLMRNDNKPGFLKVLFIGFLVYLLGGFPTLAFALPQGGDIVSGSATIDSTTQDMTITQSTDKLITNWDSFNIDTTESVEFIQPSSGSIALNRVIGIDPSIILGTLTANGQVFLINPSGVLFGASARVDAHGLLATTLQISDQDFLDGLYNFSQDPDFSLASVVNKGEITVSGYVGLLAPAVSNSGTIVANLGSIALGSATSATVDFSGDGLINFMLTGEVSGTVTDSDGNVIDDRVSNSGLIQANGGQVILAAKDAGDVIRKVVNNTGVIEARTVEEKEGKIILSGGDNGIVSSSGTLDASGDDAGETGGTVEVLGQTVELIDNAKVDVSGDAGGGTALIGGDFQGQGDTITAFNTYVGDAVTISADAITSGDGGTVIVWADGATEFNGSISATGGAESGNGGFVEISGHDNLIYGGSVDVSSVTGQGGTVLFDPANIVVGGDGSTMSASDITDITNLGGGVILQANNDITINEAIVTIGSGGSGSGGDLTLTAGRSVLINANITTDGGDLTIMANAGTDFGADTDEREIGVAEITMLTGTALNTGTGNITITMDDGTGLVTSSANHPHRTDLGHHPDHPLNGDPEPIGESGLITLETITGGTLTVNNNGDLGDAAGGIVLNGVILTGGNATFNAGLGSLLIGANITSGGSMTLNADSGIEGSGPLILIADDGIDVNNDFSSDGTLIFNADADATGSGTLDLAGVTVTTTNGGDIIITAADLIFGALVSSGNIEYTDSQGGNIEIGAGDLGNITANNLTVNTDGSITVDGVTDGDTSGISGTTTLNAGLVSFDNVASTFTNGLTVNAEDGITINVNLESLAGGISLDGDSDDTGLDTISLGANVTTSGENIDFLSAVALTADSSVDTGAGIGDITFSDSVSGDHLLSLAAGTGNIDFNADVGAGVSTPLLAVVINSVGDFTAAGDFYAASITQVAGTGTTTFGGDVFTTSASGISLTGSSFSFGGAVSTGTSGGGVSVVNSGLLAMAEANWTLDGAFSQTGSGTVQTAADITTTNDDIIFTGPVTLTDDVDLNTGAGLGDITLNAVDGAYILTLAAGTGVVTLDGIVGGLDALNGLNVDNALSIYVKADVNVLNPVSFTASNGISIKGAFTVDDSGIGSSTFNADSDNDGSGDFDLLSGASISTGNNPIIITASDIDLQGVLNAGGLVILASNGGTIGLGGSTGDMTISQSEFDNMNIQIDIEGEITPGGIAIGDETAGAITVDDLDVGDNSLELTSGSAIDDADDGSPNIITTGLLVLNANGDIGSLGGPEGLNIDAGELLFSNGSNDNFTVTNLNSSLDDVFFGAVTDGTGNISYTLTNGNLLVDQVITLGDVTLEATTGSILDANDVEGPDSPGYLNIEGDTANLTALSGIGEEGNRVETSVDTLNASTTGPDGDIFFAEEGDVALNDITTEGGDIDGIIGGEFTEGNVSADDPGTVTLNGQQGDIVEPVPEGVNQATVSTFLTDFFENVAANCGS